mmetsp:Transcript_36714/g.59325  ORF Transcript_36714/g.59325 Transcript_36714/m.59325 type:complete len:145 (-) Transcript_36714:735-1169(-)|eukprot:CAMPEP_0184656934 /NCGR_PEP_ID=MMETSP0308-20130426/16857_1 /TAXON_ID=38269 /ORGANISM="Gloeochaete witrockiana, Strain SAG 46.84" /LENGTH=144 /DNA_ID=CAMNT_0027094267 /DNA_START=49 /DNA_END=483 /DNA_ORIENTATION=-
MLASASRSLKNVSAEELATWLLDKRKSTSKGLAIVDCRDGDYDGGHIKGAMNVPSLVFDERLDSLIKKTSSSEKVVFHCMYSQQRGPKCASAFASRLSELNPQSRQEVYVLRGGFQGFYHQNKARPELFADLEPDRWEEELSNN